MINLFGMTSAPSWKIKAKAVQSNTLTRKLCGFIGVTTLQAFHGHVQNKHAPIFIIVF